MKLSSQQLQNYYTKIFIAYIVFSMNTFIEYIPFCQVLFNTSSLIGTCSTTILFYQTGGGGAQQGLEQCLSSLGDSVPKSHMVAHNHLQHSPQTKFMNIPFNSKRCSPYTLPTFFFCSAAKKPQSHLLVFTLHIRILTKTQGILSQGNLDHACSPSISL